MKDDPPLQLSITKIAPDVYRIVVQSARRTLYTANVEAKHIQKAISAELSLLHSMPLSGGM